ncbi:MAG: ABC transporter permease [Chloroflexi bacterium]|nr:ABC transporter permease [Chloroflexota bacterium]
MITRAAETLGTLAPRLIAVPVALAVGLLLLWVADAPPLQTLRLLIEGSLGSQQRIGDTLMVWAPLALACAALVVTFTAGLWNIGVEGQIVAGAIAATWVARELSAPPAVVMASMLVAGTAGGAAWAGLLGVLNVRGGVHEIFGGLGLTFVATGAVIYLVLGPWKRAGVASTSGTDLFPREVWFPTMAALRVSPLAVGLGVIAVVGVFLLLRRTRFGLRLRATGQGRAAAARLGVPTERCLMYAFLLSGALAGIAGAVLVGAQHHKLVPSVSGGYGFLGILVVLLASYRIHWAAPIALFFAIIANGSVQLQLRLDLHSSLGGVFQGVLVLAVLLAGGWQMRRARERDRKAAARA